MAEILQVDEIKTRMEEAPSTCPPIDKNIMEQIMVDPMAILNDNKFMLTYVVNNGINCSLLCEALGVSQLRINIDGIEYKMFYSKPSPYFEHSDVVFHTERFQKYHVRTLLVKERIDKARQEGALPTSTEFLKV